MLKNAHLRRCRYGFCTQHTTKVCLPPIESIGGLLRLASGTFLSINFEDFFADSIQNYLGRFKRGSQKIKK